MDYSISSGEGYITRTCVHCCSMTNKEWTSENSILVPTIDYVQVELYHGSYVLVANGYAGSYLPKTWRFSSINSIHIFPLCWYELRWIWEAVVCVNMETIYGASSINEERNLITADATINVEV